MDEHDNDNTFAPEPLVYDITVDGSFYHPVLIELKLVGYTPNGSEIVIPIAGFCEVQPCPEQF